MLEDRIERGEIAEMLGYKNPVSLDNYMRRRNFSWDARQKNFVPAVERYSGKGKDNLIELHGISKTDMIISLFNQGESDAKVIARQVGFDTHTELVNFMKNKGYNWDSRQGNYVEMPLDKAKEIRQEVKTDQLEVNTSMNELVENIIPLLKNLQKPNKIITSFEESVSLPRYQLKGMYGIKAVRMANVLDVLVRDYSMERNISQREIIEITLIEFFKKYGYGEKVGEYLAD